MTRDDIIRMAREAWLMDKHDCSDDWFVRADIDEKNIFEFAALVAAEKEKQIINILERLQQHPDFHNYYTYAIDVIRQEYPR